MYSVQNFFPDSLGKNPLLCDLPSIYPIHLDPKLAFFFKIFILFHKNKEQQVFFIFM